MSTTYYLRTGVTQETTCEHCNCKQQKDERLVVGVSSGGWCFALNVIPNRWLDTLEDWQELFYKPSTRITDEYGSAISPEEMLRIITARYRVDPIREEFESKPYLLKRWYKDYDDFLQLHNAVEGPNNLLRCKVDGKYCLGHGEGTWDYVVIDDA